MPQKKHSIKKFIMPAALFFALALIFYCLQAEKNNKLRAEYEKRWSLPVLDRGGQTMFLQKNYLGYYAVYAQNIPENLKKPLLAKEDRYFYGHFGINPISIVKALLKNIGIGSRKGSSTITQQTAKILMGQENQRNIVNKIREAFGAIALEAGCGKEEILNRYGNLIFFGNQIQGFQTASLAYFNAPANLLNTEQTFQLLATISNPSENPASKENIAAAKILAKNLNAPAGENYTQPAEARKNLENFLKNNETLFELKNYFEEKPPQKTQTTLDSHVNSVLREIIARNIKQLGSKKAKHAAALVIKLPENEILAMSGSPDPDSDSEGYKINMLFKPRQIGSTVKPFIYLKAFEKGARPYTVIDDREYKYPAGENFSIYPQNYDNIYHGKITAHYALANSINVAAAIALEFVGAQDFGDFMENSLEMKTQQDYSDYQIGIALGVAETDIMSLARAFTILPKYGQLDNLKLFYGQQNQLFSLDTRKKAADSQYVQLINKILSDRAIAQDQFGSQTLLNLEANNYALKTGTSHDYTDSWIIGYTPDFLAAVWVGNADNSPMEGLSGQLGAGKIWAQIMQAMLSSKYDKKTRFDFSSIAEYRQDGTIEYGLKNDDYEKQKNIIEESKDFLILKPHDGDTYEFSEDAKIILKAKRPASWRINGKDFGYSAELVFAPPSDGSYKILAESQTQKEEITVVFLKR